jgi:hypothetical protein
MAPVDATVLDTGLVSAHTSDQDKFLFAIKAPDSPRRIGHQEDQCDCPGGTKGSNDEELIAPGLKCTLDVADTVAWFDLSVTHT